VSHRALKVSTGFEYKALGDRQRNSSRLCFFATVERPAKALAIFPTLDRAGEGIDDDAWGREFKALAVREGVVRAAAVIPLVRSKRHSMALYDRLLLSLPFTGKERNFPDDVDGACACGRSFTMRR